MLDAPEQIVFVPEIAAVGLLFTVNALLLVAVQPLALVTVTLYAPAVETVIAAVVAPLLHKYEVPPEAVKLVLLPEQIVFVPVIAAVGLLFTVSALLLVAVHPFALVTVTLYVPAVPIEIAAVVAPLLHR